MAGERHGIASWPGAIAVASCSYTVSHGISPGSAVLEILPQGNFPDETGDLVIDDGVGKVTIPDCKVDTLRVVKGDGFTWSIAILDRRWKWRDLGQISGCYNQLDDHGKLRPYTIRSPKELAKLCLEAMGETRYEIDLPPGLTKAQGEQFDLENPAWIGVTPTTGTNPPVNWVQETPAVALQNLCEQFGRRVIYQLRTDSILIAIPGRGGELPGGSISSEAPSIDSPEVPSGVAVVGAPTRYQARFLLEAVGEEWDGSYRAIDELSYKPNLQGKVQITRALASTTGTNTFAVYIGEPDLSLQGAAFLATDSSASAAMTALAAAINASNDPRVAGVVTAEAAGDVLTITGVRIGVSFGVWSTVVEPVDDTAYFVPELAQAAAPNESTWKYCVPPLFAGVQETDRLTLVDAMRLAQKSVYRTYRLVNGGLNGKGPLVVPGYGPLVRRQQLLLLPTKVEQIHPLPIDPRLQNVVGQAVIKDFYNGYSRDMPAACYGSTAVLDAPGGARFFWVPSLGFQNTDASQQIYIDFSIDPEQQIVTFSAPVYKSDGAAFLPAEPILETACLIRHKDSNALECYRSAKALSNASGYTNYAFRKYEDVQLNVIVDYGDNNSVTRVRLLEIDAVARAKHYVAGLEAQYLTAAADTRQYNGIVPIDLDGAISQVTWNVGPGGATTTASANTEHAIWIPPYPARRRAEFLRPAMQASLMSDANPSRINVMDPP
jgi:hypothetical protein